MKKSVDRGKNEKNYYIITKKESFTMHLFLVVSTISLIFPILSDSFFTNSIYRLKRYVMLLFAKSIRFYVMFLCCMHKFSRKLRSYWQCCLFTYGCSPSQYSNKLGIFYWFEIHIWNEELRKNKKRL